MAPFLMGKIIPKNKREEPSGSSFLFRGTKEGILPRSSSPRTLFRQDQKWKDFTIRGEKREDNPYKDPPRKERKWKRREGRRNDCPNHIGIVLLIIPFREDRMKWKENCEKREPHQRIIVIILGAVATERILPGSIPLAFTWHHQIWTGRQDIYSLFISEPFLFEWHDFIA